MTDKERIEQLEQELRDAKLSFAALVEMKDRQLADYRRQLHEYGVICDRLKVNILAKDNEIARLRP